MRARAGWTVRVAAGLLTLAGLGHTLWTGVVEPGVALAFGTLIAVGELARGDRRAEDAGHLPREDREPAPLGSAGALTYALLGQNAGHPTHHGVLQIVAVVVAAALAGIVPHVARGRGPSLDHVARRVLTVGFAAVCFQPLYNSGRLEERLGQGPYVVLFLLLLLGLTALCDAVLAAALAGARTGWPYGPLLRDALRAQLGIGAAICATGVVMALGVAVAGLWALPVFSVPLLLTQLSFHRIAAIRTTYRQTITSLARATEIAGYTPPGHSRRVAALSCAVGRDLGLSERELTVLEYAALMHDIGQLSLVDPVPLRGHRLPAPGRGPPDRRAGRRGGPPDRGARGGRGDRGAAGRAVPGPARRRPDRARGERVRGPRRAVRREPSPGRLTGRPGAAPAGHRARLPAGGRGVLGEGSGQGRAGQSRSPPTGVTHG